MILNRKEICRSTSCDAESQKEPTHPGARETREVERETERRCHCAIAIERLLSKSFYTQQMEESAILKQTPFNRLGAICSELIVLLLEVWWAVSRERLFQSRESAEAVASHHIRTSRIRERECLCVNRCVCEGVYPGPLMCVGVPYEAWRALHSLDVGYLVVPPFSESRTGAFSHRAPLLWQWLPVSVWWWDTLSVRDFPLWLLLQL